MLVPFSGSGIKRGKNLNSPPVEKMRKYRPLHAKDGLKQEVLVVPALAVRAFCGSGR